MPVSTLFEEEVARQRYRTLDELRNVMNLTWLRRKYYRVITTLADFDAALKEALQHEIWAVDTETTGLFVCNLERDNPLKDSLAGICISWKRNQGIYIPLAHTQFANLPKDYVLKKLRYALEHKTIICHNGLYDGKVFYDEGIRLNIKHDTLLLYFNIDSNVSHGKKGLKPLTEKKYDYEVIEFSDIFTSSKDYGLFRYLPIDLVEAYACADSDHTLQLFMDSFMYLTPGQQRSYALDILVQNEVIRSEYCGKGIDLELCDRLNDVNNKDLESLALAIQKYAHYLVCKHKQIPYKPGSYKFNIGSADSVSQLFYDYLGYTITKRNELTGLPSVDKFVLKALLRERSDTIDEFEASLLESIEYGALKSRTDLTYSKKDTILVDAKQFKRVKYKLPYLISLWRKLEKFRTAFFAPLLNNNYEHKYFSSISLTRTQTARLIDPLQTMVGSLKKLIVPYDQEDEYFIDFDFAQIEYRVMAGLARLTWLVERLRDPEADYHREGGSMILNKAPEDITKDERGGLKSVNFGIPYGMSDVGITENRYGIGLSKEEFDEKLLEVQELLRRWNEGLHEIAEMLDRYRDIACTPVPDHELPETLRGRKLSRLANPLGRTRVFDLERHDGRPMEQSDYGSIRRQAGNYPIQSYAREIFCLAFINLCNRLKREGYMDRLVADETMPSGYRFENDVVIIAYIHDECLLNVKKTINPNKMHVMILEECMQVIEGHPNYYCGINVITNWYEGKSDLFEAPVGFVQELQQKFKDGTEAAYDPKCNQRDWVLAQIKEWISRRGLQEVQKFIPDILDTHCLDMRKIRPVFKNYFIKPKLWDFFGKWRDIYDAKTPLDKYTSEYTKTLAQNLDSVHLEDDFTQVLLETFLLSLLPALTVIYEDGTTYEITREMIDDKFKYDYTAVVMQKLEASEESNILSAMDLTMLDDEDRDLAVDYEYADVKVIKAEIAANPDGLTNLFAAVKEDMQNQDILHL